MKTLEELQKAFKPEFGNSHHVYILELSQKARRKKELLPKTKAVKTHIKKLITEAEEAEKKLHSALQYEYDKQLSINQ